MVVMGLGAVFATQEGVVHSDWSDAGDGRRLSATIFRGSGRDCPAFIRSMQFLTDDLVRREMVDDTLVRLMSEHGRTLIAVCSPATAHTWNRPGHPNPLLPFPNIVFKMLTKNG